MVGKVIIFGVTCLAILFMGVTTASSFRTTITIAENPWEQMSQRCQMEMQRAQNLRACEEYLRQSTKFTEEGRYMDQQSGDWRQSFPRYTFLQFFTYYRRLILFNNCRLLY